MRGTNENAEKKISKLRSKGKLKKGSRWHKWKAVTQEDIRHVLAVLLNIEIINVPDLESYWKTSWICNIPFFHDVISKNRFLDTFWMLHLPSISTDHPRRIDKIQPLLDELIPTFQQSFIPAQNVSVDETMVGFKGRVKFKQYCKDKLTKWGLKVFTLADSATGYIFNLLPYTGRETQDVFSPQFKELNLTGQIVSHLMTPLLGKSYRVFADRYYSGVPLAEQFYRNQTGYTGTIMQNRHQLPKPAKQLKLNKGDMQAWRHNQKLVLGWKDKQSKPTLLISTICSAETTVVQPGNPHRGAVDKPLVVHRYNQSMNGVDKADQYSVYYRFVRRSLKWWRKLFFWAGGG